MNKVWLKNYPHGVPAEINPNEYPSLTAVFEIQLRALRGASRFQQPRPHDHLCRVRPAGTPLRGLAAAERETAAGRPHRDHAAEHPAVSDRVVRRAARRAHRRQHQSALHRARARASAQRFRREGDRDPGELRAHARTGDRAHEYRARARHRRRRPARLAEVRDRELRRAPRAKQVPPYELPGALRFNDALATGPVPAVRAGDDDARRHRLPAVHRRHHGRREGRDAHASQHGREHAAGGARGSAPKRSSGRTRSSRRCRCITSSR